MSKKSTKSKNASAHASTILLLGPKHADNARGGVTVLFELFCSDLVECRREFVVLDTNSRSYSGKLAMFLAVLKGLVQNCDKDILIFNATQNDVLFLGPIIAIWKIVFKKRVALRKFAGSFAVAYQGSCFWKRQITRLTLKRFDVLFFETKDQVAFFKRLNGNTHLFPNVRRAANLQSPPYRHGRFEILFASTMCKEKGVVDLLDAVLGDERFRLTVAGPPQDETILRRIESQDNATYVGVIDSADVIERMSKSHVLALPTYYEGEGYPGVIIEAFSVGLPVISTTWRAVPELVGENGVLVEPRNVAELRNALITVLQNHGEYKTRSARAFWPYNSGAATRRALAICENIRMP